jgi:hypothetical protein
VTVVFDQRPRSYPVPAAERVEVNALAVWLLASPGSVSLSAGNESIMVPASVLALLTDIVAVMAIRQQAIATVADYPDELTKTHLSTLFGISGEQASDLLATTPGVIKRGFEGRMPIDLAIETLAQRNSAGSEVGEKLEL